MNLTKKTLFIMGIASLPLLAAAEFQNPTETPFYKRGTGQDDEFTRKEAERQKIESVETYVRVVKGLSSKLESDNRTDVNEIAKDWSSNAARAKIRYSKPGYYRGVLDHVTMVGENAAMVMQSSDGKGVVAYPFYLQGVMKENELVDIINAVEYAAQYDAGQTFNMLCAEAYPKELHGCLMFFEGDFKME
jgi:hypothetical protein